MTELRISTHSRFGSTIVEVWEDGHFIAGIYPKDRGVKIISKYLDGHRPDLVTVDPSFPPAMNVNIWTGQSPATNSHETPSPQRPQKERPCTSAHAKTK